MPTSAGSYRDEESGGHRPDDGYRPRYRGTRSGARTDFGRCYICIRIFKWFPVLFITSILAWGFYAYIMELCILTVDSVVQKALYLFFFFIFYFMTLWSYFQTIFARTTGNIPREFYLSHSDWESYEKCTNEEEQRSVLDEMVQRNQLPLQCRTYLGGYRYCEKCFLVKPDRAHHCSVCAACVLKMDHHCPWVNNCVAFNNYKFFILFLGYAFFLCLYTAATTFPYFLKFWQGELGQWGKFHILFLFFVSIMFAISLVSLFGYHIYLVLCNRSTLESFRAPVFASGPDKNAYNLGSYKNFCEVFGHDKLFWFLPLYTSNGDGLQFPTRLRREESSRMAGDSTMVVGTGPGGVYIGIPPPHAPLTPQSSGQKTTSVVSTSSAPTTASSSSSSHHSKPYASCAYEANGMTLNGQERVGNWLGNNEIQLISFESEV